MVVRRLFLEPKIKNDAPMTESGRLRSHFFTWNLGPYVAIPLTWVVASILQYSIPALELQPSLYLVYLPAGVRTVAVFIYGFRGALVTGATAFLTTSYTLSAYGSDAAPLPSTVLESLLPPLICWLTVVIVCRWENVPNTLAGLTVKHIATIVLIQSMLIAAFLQSLSDRLGQTIHYEHFTNPDYLKRWAVVYFGDVLGAFLGLTILIVLYYLLDKFRGSNSKRYNRNS